MDAPWGTNGAKKRVPKRGQNLDPEKIICFEPDGITEADLGGVGGRGGVPGEVRRGQAPPRSAKNSREPADFLGILDFFWI